MALPSVLFDFDDSEDEFVSPLPLNSRENLKSKPTLSTRKKILKLQCTCATDDRHWTDFPGLIVSFSSNFHVNMSIAIEKTESTFGISDILRRDHYFWLKYESLIHCFFLHGNKQRSLL